MDALMMQQAKMQSAFLPSAKQPAPKVKQPKAVMPPSAKILAMEQAMRSDTIQQKTAQESASQGGAETPTPKQKDMINKFDPQNTMYRDFGNKLGDYSSTLNQMVQTSNAATVAMSLSTLESKKPSVNMATSTVEQFQMLNSEFGLDSRANRVYKKARKYSRLGASDSML
jgi:hypothetical protein